MTPYDDGNSALPTALLRRHALVTFRRKTGLRDTKARLDGQRSSAHTVVQDRSAVGADDQADEDSA